MAGSPRVIGKPTVDDATLTGLPVRITVEGKPSGPRLAWPIIPVKRFVAVRSHAWAWVRRRTARSYQGALSAGECLVVADDTAVEVSEARRETFAASPSP